MKRSTTPFGEALARKVVERLSDEPLAYHHRDYCGTGLTRGADGHCAYAEFQDGIPDEVPLLAFETPEALVAWLAVQSDQSLCREQEPNSGFITDNQVITRTRLLQFVR